MLLVLVTVLIYALLTFLGWGLAAILLPDRLRPYQVWLSPWLGIAVISVLSLWFSRFGIGTEISIYFILAIALILLALGRYRKAPRLTHKMRTDHLLITLSVLVGLGFSLTPMLIVDGVPTTISLGNNDPHDYALLGDYLKNHGIYQLPTLSEVHPNLYVIRGYLPAVRSGTWLFYSAISSALHLSTHQIFSVTLGIIYALTPGLLCIFTCVISHSRTAALFALVVSTLNVNWLHITYHGFGAQVPATGFLIFAFLLFFLATEEVFEHEHKKRHLVEAVAKGETEHYCEDYDGEDSAEIGVIEKHSGLKRFGLKHLGIKFLGLKTGASSGNFLRSVLLLGLTISCLFSMYVELTPFFFAPFCLCLCLIAFRGVITSNAKQVFRTVGAGIAIILATIIIDPISPVETLRRLIIASGTAAGWPIPFAFPAEMLGFLSVHSDMTAPFSLSVLMGVLVAALIGVGFAKSNHRTFFLSFLLSYLAALGYMAFVRVYAYGYYKSVTFSLFVFIILFSIGLEKTLDFIFEKLVLSRLNINEFRLRKSIVHLTVMVTIAVCLLSPVVELYTRNMRGHLSVDPSLAGLESIRQEIPQDKEIYLHQSLSLWEQMWSAKFIGGRPLSFSIPSPYYGDEKFFKPTAPSDALILAYDLSPLIQPADADSISERTLWSSGKYSLTNQLSTSLQKKATVGMGDHWYFSERVDVDGDGDYAEFRWLDQDATLNIKALSSSVQSVEISMRLHSVRVPAPTIVNIYANDTLLSTVRLDGATVETTLSVPLEGDSTVLRFHTVEGTIRPSNGDSRDIAVGVSAIKFDVR